jgi:hypothetical protein
MYSAAMSANPAGGARSALVVLRAAAATEGKLITRGDTTRRKHRDQDDGRDAPKSDITRRAVKKSSWCAK